MSPEDQAEMDRRIAQLMEQMQAQQALLEALQANSSLVAASSAPAPSLPPAPSRIRGDKVPVFNGTAGEDLHNWLHKVSLIVTESGETRHDKIIASVSQGLHGEAYSWFRSACDSKLINALSSWDDLKDALRSRFAPVDELQVGFIWLLDVAAGQAGISVDSIGSFISELRSKATVCNGHLSDQLLNVILLRALPPSIKSQLALQITPAMSLEEAAGKAFRLARTLALEGMLEHPSNLPIPLVGSSSSAVLAGPVPMELSALSLSKAPRDNKCRYCHQPGHWARDRVSKKATCPLLIKAEADAAAAGH